MTFTIPAQYHQKPLKVFLQAELGLSARLLSRLKATPCGILLDGKPVTVRATLCEGSTLTLAIDTPSDRPSGIVPTALPLDVLYEDAHILVCNKPGNMPTHPSHGHYTDTLANAVAYHARADKGFVFHPINRLDRNTSGVVLIARHALAAQRLAAAMLHGDIRKTYLALLCGEPMVREGEIITGIRRQAESIIIREVCGCDAPSAARAQTQYTVLGAWEPADKRLPPRLCLVRAQPLTGRTHQLRLHFSYLGTPILGDDMYGQGALPALLERQALHACRLEFVHPMSGEPMCLTAPLPEDMRHLLPNFLSDADTYG